MIQFPLLYFLFNIVHRLFIESRYSVPQKNCKFMQDFEMKFWVSSHHFKKCIFLLFSIQNITQESSSEETLSNYEPMVCAYVLLIMSVYWMTEALPLPVTSLIPIVAFPFFGVLSTVRKLEAVLQTLVIVNSSMFMKRKKISTFWIQNGKCSIFKMTKNYSVSWRRLELNLNPLQLLQRNFVQRIIYFSKLFNAHRQLVENNIWW